jgi:HK97 family phage prohead protease
MNFTTPRLTELQDKRSVLLTERTSDVADLAALRAKETPNAGNASENRVRAILGEPLLLDVAPDRQAIQTLLQKIPTLNGSIGIIDGLIAAEKAVASRLLCEAQKPEVTKRGKAFAKAFVDLHAAQLEYHAYLDKIQDAGASIGSLPHVFIHGLGDARDRSGTFFPRREGFHRGWLSLGNAERSPMIFIDAADLRVFERGQAVVERYNRGGFMNALMGEVTNRALDGQANPFNKAFPYRNSVVLLKAGCFGKLNDHKVRFLIDHNENCEVADTDDALELMVDSDGIQFRLDLEKTRRGNVIARMCEVDNRASISVGCDILEEHDETINGKTVRIITRARLREISVCQAGAAGDDAFGMLVDTTVTPKPAAGSRSSAFRAGQIVHKLSRKVRALKTTIAAMYDDKPPQRQWSMTIDESNREQTAEVERLQQRARSRLNH